VKVVLANPPAVYELVGNDPVIIKEQQGTYPPLGLLSIAGYLLKHTDHDVKVLDAQVENWNHEELAQKVTDLNPEVVGITTMTFTIIDCKIFITKLKERCPAIVVVGGPHVAIYPEESLLLGADYSVVGEGELTFKKLLEDIALGKAKNRVYRQNEFIKDLDEIPFPARELTPINKYYSVLAEQTPTTTAFSSRGCPYQCIFCDRPALGKDFRAQSAKRVVDEMQWCEKKGIKEIFFYDDTFTIGRKRVQEICSEYERRNLTIRWDIRARVNTVDKEIIRSLKRCNVTRIHFGVESASTRILKEIRKGITPEQVYRAFEDCQQNGIKTLAYFMMGNPTETLEDIKESLKMAKTIKADFMQMTILSLFPGTQIYDMARKEGLVQGDPWRDYVKDPKIDFRPPMWEAIYSKEEHEEHLRWFYKHFYLRPKFLFDRLLEIRNPGQFKRYFSAGFSLVRMALQKESKVKIASDTINKIHKMDSGAPISVPCETLD